MRICLEIGDILNILLTPLARNLYGIDYVKMHGPTTAAAFKVIWDGLDSETAKVCHYNFLSVSYIHISTLEIQSPLRSGEEEGVTYQSSPCIPPCITTTRFPSLCATQRPLYVFLALCIFIPSFAHLDFANLDGFFVLCLYL